MNSSTKLYIGGLDPHITDSDVRKKFEQFGKLKSVWVARKPPGFAFIEYEDEESSKKAVKEMDGEKFLGERIKVQFSNQNKLNANRDKGCYKCGSRSHLARDCSRSRSRSRSRSYRRSRRKHSRRRSYSSSSRSNSSRSRSYSSDSHSSRSVSSRSVSKSSKSSHSRKSSVSRSSISRSKSKSK